MCYTIIPHGIAQGVDYVVLTPHLDETLRAVTPVERLVVDH
jgi:hypothetical protein